MERYLLTPFVFFLSDLVRLQDPMTLWPVSHISLSDFCLCHFHCHGVTWGFLVMLVVSVLGMLCVCLLVAPVMKILQSDLLVLSHVGHLIQDIYISAVSHTQLSHIALGLWFFCYLNFLPTYFFVKDPLFTACKKYILNPLPVSGFTSPRQSSAWKHLWINVSFQSDGSFFSLFYWVYY